MNQSFSFNRWWLLVSKHWAEHRRLYGLSLVAIGALLLLWFTFEFYMEPYEAMHYQVQTLTYFIGISLAGCIFGSMLFAELGTKSKAQNYLSLPASHLEKLLCNLLFGVVLFFVCYTLVFYLIDIIMVRIADAIAYKHWLATRPYPQYESVKLANVFVMPDRPYGAPNVFFYFLLAYFACQAAFILGSVYFPRYSFIKTVITLLVVGLFFTFLIMKLLHTILPYGDFHHGLTGYRIMEVRKLPNGGISYSTSMSDKIVSLPAWIEDWLLFLLKYAFAPIFWVVTYFRLKEKEI